MGKTCIALYFLRFGVESLKWPVMGALLYSLAQKSVAIWCRGNVAMLVPIFVFVFHEKLMSALYYLWYLERGNYIAIIKDAMIDMPNSITDLNQTYVYE
jgi:hypothetical protein